MSSRDQRLTAQDRWEIAFPRFTPEEIAAMSFAETRSYADGEPLFSAGETGFPFFVVLSGGIQIVEESTGARKTVVVHDQPGDFTGDVDMLTGRPALISGIAKGPTQALALQASCLRQIVKQTPELSDRILKAFMMRRQLLLETEFVGVRVIGSRLSPETLRIREFLAKNNQPFTWTDLERNAEAEALLQTFGVAPEETPVVACDSRSVLRNPTNEELAQCLGIKRPIERALWDLVVVGAGPAGLAAAVYGASEGLKTLVLDSMGPGGQAGTSSKIENYMGFPTGLSGAELASRAVLQAEKFGAEISAPSEVQGFRTGLNTHTLQLTDGTEVCAKSILISSGASYRRLPAQGVQEFEGKGVFYACTAVEAMLCEHGRAIVVGGGNSAGQAAVFLSTRCQGVTVIIRGDDLSKGMSEYLASRIERHPKIDLRVCTEIRRLEGDGSLERVHVVNNQTGEETEMDAVALFVFVGAMPHTKWLPPTVATDDKGFVLTGPEAKRTGWKLDRDPMLLETSVPGVFAAGDVRSASIKRVASAVGEGSMTVHMAHRYLAGL
ncbi:MAG: cyclic nucleotide-binding domain-containing protein [Acidobacteria bacterium]|nr:cyclic nucleotide-binding domain-containing protein [Acidobacteriota bacterium]